MTSTDFDPSSAAVGPDISGLVATALSPADKTTALTKVRYLERELLDDDGHVRKGMTAARADEIVDLINELRRALGWLEIDLRGTLALACEYSGGIQIEPNEAPGD